MAKDRKSELKRIIRECTTEQGELPPTKDELLNAFDLKNWESLRSHMNDLTSSGDVITVEDGQRVRYAPASYDPEQFAEDKDKLTNTIRDTIKDLRTRIRRDPTVEEMGEECGRNPDDDVFRTVFYTVAMDMDWQKPTEKQRESAQRTLRNILRGAIDRQYGITPRSSIPDEIKSDTVSSYIDEHEDLLDDVEVRYNEDRSTAIATLPDRIRKYAGTERLRYDLTSSSNDWQSA